MKEPMRYEEDNTTRTQKYELDCKVCRMPYTEMCINNEAPNYLCHSCWMKQVDESIQRETESCLDEQVGGDHYHQGTIQPIDYIHANKLNFFEGNAIKYITRNRRKGSPVEDLKKAIHYLQLQLMLEHALDSRIEYNAVHRD